MADKLNSMKKYVASRTLSSADWNNTTLIEGDVADYVTALKGSDGPDIEVHGSWGLVQTLLKHDLVDVFNLMIFPVVLGLGKRLFDEGTIAAGLRLVEHRVASTGVIIGVYERAGDIELGSFALEVPTEDEVERRHGLAEA